MAACGCVTSRRKELRTLPEHASTPEIASLPYLSAVCLEALRSRRSRPQLTVTPSVWVDFLPYVADSRCNLLVA